MYGGASGGAAKELEKALHFKLPADEIHPAWKSLGERFTTGSDSKSRLLWANRMWVDRSIALKRPFVDLLHVDYGVEPAAVDLNDAAKVATEANQWVARGAPKA